ncbi:MAG: stage V sporulation protein AC [Syntrophomonadaceae bacterium]|jgi:stage V sporulation protein AC|nr:stage V sporulation protein AC [Syntrophomonadaceae bacterium]
MNDDELKQVEIADYKNQIEKIKPQPKLLKNCIWAFTIGGFICLLAQIIFNYLLTSGLDKIQAGNAVAVIMIFLGALLTGLGVYDKIVEKAGAGAIVPITGFANAIVASAMEFKREGYVFGVGAKIFSVAGPTLLFGFVFSALIGLIKVFVNA